MKLFFLSLIFIISANLFSQTPTKLSSGQFGFNEGPVWDRNDIIYFSDIGNRKIETYTVSTGIFGTATLLPSGTRTNGLMFNKNMDLLVCEFSNGAISRRNTNGVIQETFTSTFRGARYNNPNDLCVDKRGGIYFTDPTGNTTPPQSQKRVYYLSPENTLNGSRTVTIVDDSLIFPNGVLVSTNGRNLFISDTENHNIYKYTINPNNGAVSNRTVFATLADNDPTEPRSLADGMALDTNGNLYVCAAKSIQVFNPRGRLINTFNFDQNPTNCTFGGVNLSTLFVTTPKDLYSISLSVRGFQHPFDLPEISKPTTPTEPTPNIKPLTVFPNPVTDKMFQIAVGSRIIKSISIATTRGKKRRSLNFSRNNDLLKVTIPNNIATGMYILTIVTNNSDRITRRISIK